MVTSPSSYPLIVGFVMTVYKDPTRKTGKSFFMYIYEQGGGDSSLLGASSVDGRHCFRQMPPPVEVSFVL